MAGATNQESENFYRDKYYGRLESSMDEIKADMRDIKADMKIIKEGMIAYNGETKDAINGIRKEVSDNFYKTLVAIGVMLSLIAGISKLF